MIGLVVNPVAGLGGAAGLAGSDGELVQRRARERGGVSRAEDRAVDALRVLAEAKPDAAVLTAAGPMGEAAVTRAGLGPEVVFHGEHETSALDTRAAAAALAREGADLVLFAGGDGTARDIASGLPPGVAALGIPAGVKMYSAVFAVGPRAAGAIAARWLRAELPLVEREVLDVDEEAQRRARVEPRLFGVLPVPFQPGRTQARKGGSAGGDREAVRAAAVGARELLRPGVRYLLGPGGTMAELAALIGVAKTPLGVDVVVDGRVVLAGASETELLEEVARGPSRAVVTIIGGQGFLLGRGNQQLSARVIRALGEDPLLVVATQQKLIDLAGRPLLVDTGDPDLDAALAGFARVVTAASTVSIYPVSAPEHEGAGHAP
jgi:predicted polyphosphate/ATP-dependent NAD kinase